MNVRWLWLDPFPAGLDLSAAERAKAKRMAKLHWKREPTFRGGVRIYRRSLLPFALAVAALIVIIQFGNRGWAQFAPAVYMITFWSMTSWALHRARVPFIRQALNDLGHPVCVGCGYLLRGVPEPRCPECGEVRVQLHKQSLTPEERSDPEIVEMMRRLGYSACVNCGTMWEKNTELTTCPKCHAQLEQGIGVAADLHGGS